MDGWRPLVGIVHRKSRMSDADAPKIDIDVWLHELFQAARVDPVLDAPLWADQKTKSDPHRA